MDIIDPIFNLHKIKFEILDKWKLLDKSVDRVVVYINLDNVFKIINTPRVNNFIQAGASMQGYDDYIKQVSISLVSNIINLGQHYRLWLAKQSIDSRIILYSNYPLPQFGEKYVNTKYLPMFRNDYILKYTLNMENNNILQAIQSAMDFCKECINYVNEVYLVNSGTIESSLVPYILNENVYKPDGVKTKYFIVSNSLYDFPYVNYDCTFLCPSIKKKEPYYVNKMNVIEVIKSRSRVKTPLSINTDLLEFINSILGDPDRNIRPLSGIGISSILKLLNKAIQEGYITENTKDINMLKEIVHEDYRPLLESNYHCTNFEYQYNDLGPLEIHQITSRLIDNYDERTLDEMNEKYFKLCPIEIIRPKSEQVKYGDRNPYDDGFSIFASKK